MNLKPEDVVKQQSKTIEGLVIEKAELQETLAVIRAIVTEKTESNPFEAQTLRSKILLVIDLE